LRLRFAARARIGKEQTHAHLDRGEQRPPRLELDAARLRGVRGPWQRVGSTSEASCCARAARRPPRAVARAALDWLPLFAAALACSLDGADEARELGAPALAVVIPARAGLEAGASRRRAHPAIGRDERARERGRIRSRRGGAAAKGRSVRAWAPPRSSQRSAVSGQLSAPVQEPEAAPEFLNGGQDLRP
jgi:hypothetical protein